MKSILYARPRTFGFHTFRRTLASVLVRVKVDIKTVQEILRHQNLKTTLEVYAKAMSEDKLEAQPHDLSSTHQSPLLGESPSIAMSPQVIC